MSILFGFVFVPIREIDDVGTRLELWSWGWEFDLKYDSLPRLGLKEVA
jgi:hypothetical protein